MLVKLESLRDVRYTAAMKLCKVWTETVYVCCWPKCHRMAWSTRRPHATSANYACARCMTVTCASVN